MRRLRFAIALLAVASVFSIQSVAQTVAAFQFLQKPGPHAVGLKVVEQYDYARTFRSATDALGKPYVGERARPLQTLIWYPAVKSDAKPMTVKDYVALAATETSFGKPNMPAEWQTSEKEMAPTLDGYRLSGRRK